MNYKTNNITRPTYCKDTIPNSIKKKVWERCRHPADYRVAQCATCENLVFAPKSISEYLIPPNLPYSNIVGCGEFGHIQSEKNGGKLEPENLTIQCKPCNTSLGTNYLSTDRLSYVQVMLDADLDDIDHMQIENKHCNYIKKNGERCKNKPIANSMLCCVHFRT